MIAIQTGRWRRFTVRNKCPICGRGGWCTLAPDGAAVKCQRIESDSQVKNSDGSSAWMHKLDGSTAAKAIKASRATKDVPRLGVAELKLMIKDQQTSLSPKRLQRLSLSLGVSEKSLKAFGVGFDGHTGCYSFPMYAGDRRPCGVRLRTEEGRKLAVPGSKNGLFIPSNFDPSLIPDCICDDPFSLTILMPEGPTDCAAAYDLGFMAIGRPSNLAGGPQIVELLKSTCLQEVVIIADHDGTKFHPSGVPFWPGWEGALNLAKQIYEVCGRLKVCKPPEKAKDLRQWVRNKGYVGLLCELIENAPIATSSWINEKQQEVETYRKRLSRKGA